MVVFTVVLSGGLTLKALYRLMATDKALRSEIPGANVHFFFGDESHFPPDHPKSNFHMVCEAMYLSMRSEQLHIHRVLGELASASQSAEEYEADLRDFFEARWLLDEGFPRFDLVFLGMRDAMVIQPRCFPHSPGLQESARWVVANRVETLNMDQNKDRITMTFPVLNSAAEVVLFVRGLERSSSRN